MTAPDSPQQMPDPVAPSGARGVATVVVLTCAFLLELVAFGALGYAGWQVGSGIGKLLLVFAVPVAAIVVWGLFAAPKAKVRLPGAARLTVELVVYAAAVGGLLLAGAVVAGIVLAGAVVVFQVVRAVLRRRGVAVTP